MTKHRPLTTAVARDGLRRATPIRPRRALSIAALSTCVAFGTTTLARAQGPDSTAAPSSSTEIPPPARTSTTGTPGLDAPLGEPGGAPATPAPAPPEAMAPPPPAPVLVAAPMEPARAPEPMASSNLPSYLLWAAGGAALILGGAFGIAAISAKSSFDDNPTYGRADSVHSRAVVADVGLGLGLILAATGTVFYFSRPAESAPQAASGAAPPARSMTLAQVSAAPVVGPATGGCVINVRF